MGAARRYYVKVARMVEDIVEVSAVTSQEAMEEAAELPGVAMSLGWAFDREELEQEEP